MSGPDPSSGEGNHYQRMLAGEPYIADDPQIAADHRRVDPGALEVLQSFGDPGGALHRKSVDFRDAGRRRLAIFRCNP